MSYPKPDTTTLTIIPFKSIDAGHRQISWPKVDTCTVKTCCSLQKQPYCLRSISCCKPGTIVLTTNYSIQKAATQGTDSSLGLSLTPEFWQLIRRWPLIPRYCFFRLTIDTLITLSQTTKIRFFQTVKEIADDNYKFDENGRNGSPKGSKTLWKKGEIARYEQFLLLSQCFQKTCTADT